MTDENRFRSSSTESPNTEESDAMKYSLENRIIYYAGDTLGLFAGYSLEVYSGGYVHVCDGTCHIRREDCLTAEQAMDLAKRLYDAIIDSNEKCYSILDDYLASDTLMVRYDYQLYKIDVDLSDKDLPEKIRGLRMELEGMWGDIRWGRR